MKNNKIDEKKKKKKHDDGMAEVVYIIRSR